MSLELQSSYTALHKIIDQENKWSIEPHNGKRLAVKAHSKFPASSRCKQLPQCGTSAHCINGITLICIKH